MSMSVDIYQYDDFRLFLADCYKDKKAGDPGCSYRTFAAEAGFSNPGFFNDVVKGRRKLSPGATVKMIKAFGLSATESAYFDLLVHYGQTRDDGKRAEVYKNILSRRNRSSFTRLNPLLAKYYQDYRYPLVRCAIEASGFSGDYARLAEFIDPPLQTAVVVKIVRDLCEWGMVEQHSDGRYVLTQKLIEPPDTLRHLVRELNGEWIKHAFSALRRLPPEDRDISSLLVTVSEDNYRKIQEKLKDLRDEIFAIARDDANPQTVMQLNIQLFPRSRKNGRGRT
jgi:uncharacterized protein (TIGR02147 family)